MLRSTLAGLDLGSSGITNDAIPALLAIGSLEVVQLWETQVTAAAAERYAEGSGLVQVAQIRSTAGTWTFQSNRRL
jgi:hypothetical protein